MHNIYDPFNKHLLNTLCQPLSYLLQWQKLQKAMLSLPREFIVHWEKTETQTISIKETNAIMVWMEYNTAA